MGYLIAGVLLGPATPGLVADVNLAQQLAEIGVILLMFGVGLLLARRSAPVRRITRFRDTGRIVLTRYVRGIGRCWMEHRCGACSDSRWRWRHGVVLRARRRLLATMTGTIAAGWLVVEDLALVFVLVLLPPLAGPLGGTPAAAGAHGLTFTLGWALARVALFVVLMLVVARRVLPWMLWRIAGAGSRELFTLAVVVVGVGVAYGSARLFGVSFALGAFLGGVVLGESALSHRAAEESLPLRDAFAVLFFVSVGMLFDPSVLVHEPLRVLVAVVVVVVVKSVIAFAIVACSAIRWTSRSRCRSGWRRSAVLVHPARAGPVARDPAGGSGNLILASAIISIAVNPFSFTRSNLSGDSARAIVAHLVRDASGRRARPAAQRGSARAERARALVGYGRVGRRIGEALQANHRAFVVADRIARWWKRCGVKGCSPFRGRRRSGGSDSGPRRAGEHARRRDAGQPSRAQDDRHCAALEPAHRDDRAHAQRRGSGTDAPRACGRGVHGRARAGDEHDRACYATSWPQREHTCSDRHRLRRS